VNVLGGSRICAAVVAAGYPWISLMARIYIDYKNDHLACALVPWVYVGIVQVASSAPRTKWTSVITTALLAGSTILVKYSLVPVLAATALYFVWLEAYPLKLMAEKIRRITAISVGLLLPGGLLWLANQAWGLESYPLQSGGGISPGPFTLVNNIVSNAFGATTGWSALLTQLNIALESHLRLSLFHGTIFTVSLILLTTWVVTSRRTKWTAEQFHFLQYMCLLTVILCAFLYAISALSAINYNFASDSRF
jgi:hypothetical protein